MIWAKYSKDLTQNVKYIEYIQSIPSLHILLTPASTSDAKVYIDSMNNTCITTLSPVCNIYVDLRYLGLPLSHPHRAVIDYELCVRWYDDLIIPNKQEYYYVLECTVESWADAKHTSVRVYCSFLMERFVMTSASVTFFCYPAPLASAISTAVSAAAPTGAPLTSSMKLVDAEFVEQYPCVLSGLSESGKSKGHNYDRSASSSSSSMHI